MNREWTPVDTNTSVAIDWYTHSLIVAQNFMNEDTFHAEGELSKYQALVFVQEWTEHGWSEGRAIFDYSLVLKRDVHAPVHIKILMEKWDAFWKELFDTDLADLVRLPVAQTTEWSPSDDDIRDFNARAGQALIDLRTSDAPNC